MMYSHLEGKKWISQTMKKLISFCDKCPVLLSTRTCLKDGKDGVYVIHQNSGAEYFFEWDFSKDPKDFVHDIKMFLQEKHYPLLIETTYEIHEFTNDELVAQLESGKSLDTLYKAEKRKSYKLWMIDKVIVPKDIFILQQLDQKTKKPIGKLARYKMNSPSIIFMNDYRNGAFKTLTDAGDAFFSQSMFIDELNKEGEKNESNSKGA